MPSHVPIDTAPNGVPHADPVRYLPLSYDSSNPDASARELVLALRPDWAEPDSKLEFVRFTDGITNTLLKASSRRAGLSTDEADQDAVLLRAYGAGTDVLIDRSRETQNHELLMKFGLAPELLARFDNGIMYRFLRGRVTSPADLRTRPVYLAVARRLAEWHSTVPCIHPAKPQTNGSNGTAVTTIAPGKPSPNLWTVMQKWILALPTETEAQRARQTTLQKELLRLVEELSNRPGLGRNGLVFAHCDLLSGNVIVQPRIESSTTNGTSCQETVQFIDYEYATPSPAAFDLANHFAEWGGFDCDFNALPTRSQRTEFIREYIRKFFSRAAPGECGELLDTEAQKLSTEVDAFRGVPGFYWGIWALIQATISQIDFDYAEYAEIRLGEYWAWRDEESGLRQAQGKEMPLRERRWAQED